MTRNAINSIPAPAEFRRIVYGYFRKEGRDLPWRHTGDPYCIYVSEVMLQQTQVSRVAEKYLAFTTRFPDFASLASASLPAVLAAWKGIG